MPKSTNSKIVKKGDHCVIEQAPVTRRIRDIVTHDRALGEEGRIAKDAAATLASWTQAWLMAVLSKANDNAIHAKRSTVLPRDVGKAISDL